MRCLTLADALRTQGAECFFVCRPHEGHLFALIGQRGHQVVPLPALTSHATYDLSNHSNWLGTDWLTDAADSRQALNGKSVDWLVVDHYALDCHWEQFMRPYCERLMVIDDLADRPHDCDVLLNQNLGRTSDEYQNLTGPECMFLMGPRYALLRPEFAQRRQQSLERRECMQCKRILVTMGGVDKDNVTGKVLDGLLLCDLPSDTYITVVMGPHAPWLQNVKIQTASMSVKTRVLIGVDDMASLMTESDLIIGAAGSTSWERCCLGVPGIQLILAQNQIKIAEALAREGAAITSDVESLNQTLKSIFSNEYQRNELIKMTYAARSVTDGFGAQRVVSNLMENR